MEKRWGRVNRGFCFGLAAVAALACATAMSWNTLLAYAANDWGGSTAWYATSPGRRRSGRRSIRRRSTTPGSGQGYVAGVPFGGREGFAGRSDDH